MRDPRKKLAKHSRRRRRAALAIILLATSPALADDLESNPVQILPPLPLKSTADAQQTQSNPFCETLVKAGSLKVQLAGGSDFSSIKLKPIGAAIGLQPINDADPNRAQSPKITIAPVPTASIQTNPMAGSMHHANDQLVDAEVDDRTSLVRPKITISSQETSAEPTGRKSSIVLLPMAPAKSPAAVQPTLESPPAIDAQPVVSSPVRQNTAMPSIVLRNTAKPRLVLQNTATPSPVLHNTAIPSPEILHAATMVPAVQNQPLMTATPVVPQEPVPQEALSVPVVAKTNQDEKKPVYFSLSDKFDSSEESQGGDAEQAIQRVGVPSTVEPECAVEPTRMAEVAEPTESAQQNTDAEEVAKDASINIGVIEPIVFGDPAAEKGLKPVDSVITDDADPPIAIYRSEQAVVGLVKTAEESLHTKRYRPPVAVRPVPIAVVRDALAEPAAIVGSAVQPLKSPKLDDFDPPSGAASGAAKLTPLYMSRTQVCSLTLGGEVRGVKVANESVCQAFAAGPNQIKLIGTGNGVTRLVVWADSDEADAPTRMRSFEVHVKDAVETTGDAVGEKAKLLNQSIHRAFPRANVLVLKSRDQLVVAGNCESEATAKQIIRMVRKTCLIPVIDELVVR
jgi:hypothetical protein